jgi:tetratricopeptide (TPR) repeat protein
MRTNRRRWLLLLWCGFALAFAAVAAAAEPQTAAEYVARGLRRLDTWQWQDALDDANAALRLQPASAPAMLVRGAAKVAMEGLPLPGMEDRSEPCAAGLRDLAEAEKRGERSARLYCEQGLAYCALRRYDKAVEAAERAMKINPKESRAYAVRGQALAAQKGLSAGMADLDKAVELDPHSAYGYGVRGETIVDWGDKLGPGPAPPAIARARQLNPALNAHIVADVAAVPSFAKAIELDPENPRYCCGRGYAKSGGNRFAEAQADLDRAVALDPKSLRACYERMHLRILVADYKAADEDAVRLIELAPSAYAGHHSHGVLLDMRGQRAEALKEVDLAIKAGPRIASRDYTLRAKLRLAKGEFSEAIADATSALEINPRQLDAHYMRGRALLQMGETKKALGDFDVLVAVVPSDAEFWTWRGDAQKELGDLQASLGSYTRALQLSPHFALASLQRGTCRVKTGDFKGAAADLHDALGHGVERFVFDGDNPGTACAHEQLGVIFYCQHKPKEALAELDQAIAIAPNCGHALAWRAMVKTYLHDYRGAIEDRTRALENYPKQRSSPIYFSRGFDKYELGDYRGAIADCGAALRIRSSFPRAYKIRAMAKLALDDCEGALADLDVALRQANDEAKVCRDKPGGLTPLAAAPGTVEETAAADTDAPFAYLAGHAPAASESPTSKADPDLLAEIYQQRGLACYQMAHYARAIKEFDQAARLSPPDEFVFFYRSMAKGGLGDWSGLLADANREIALKPRSEWACYDRAMFASLDGDYAAALATFNGVV